MTSPHKISLHLSRNESCSESPKGHSDLSSFSKASEAVHEESLKKQRASLMSVSETHRLEHTEKDTIFYKKLAKQLEKEKKALEEKNRELNVLLKEIKSKPGLEKALENSKRFLNDFQEKHPKETEEILGGNEFLALVKTNKLQEALLRTIKFCRWVEKNQKQERVPGTSRGGSPRIALSNVVEEDMSHLLKDQFMLNSKTHESEGFKPEKQENPEKVDFQNEGVS